MKHMIILCVTAMLCVTAILITAVIAAAVRSSKSEERKMKEAEISKWKESQKEIAELRSSFQERNRRMEDDGK